LKRLALAIARDLPHRPERDGLARHRSKGLAILHETAPADVLAPSLSTIEAYASTMNALHDRETILPIRFGSLHDSEASLEDWLRVHADDWRSTLDSVEGCHEMGVRVLLDAPSETWLDVPQIPSSNGRPGTSYLMARKARRDVSEAVLAEAERIAGRIVEAVGRLSRGSRIENPGPGRERLLSMSFLVDRQAVGWFREAVERLDGPLLITGPWPPYSFAGGEF
jgi:hypothetical protein